MKQEKKLSSKRKIHQLKKTIQKHSFNKDEVIDKIVKKVKTNEDVAVESKILTVILIDANLLQKKSKTHSVLLNSDDHSKFIQFKLKKDPEDFR